MRFANKLKPMDSIYPTIIFVNSIFVFFYNFFGSYVNVGLYE